MSSPSDHEKSKHSDEESLSDKESVTDEKKRIKKDRKKKRKSKDLLKSPAKVGELKSSQGTSKTGIHEIESSKKLGSKVMVENSDSNSGEKHVGAVGDNIKHLNINEDKLKDSKQKDLLKPTELQANLEASPGISMSQPEPVIESSRPQIVQQLPVNEQDSLINVLDPLDDVLTRPTTSSLEEVRGVVPNNSLNEPGDTAQPQADLRMLPSTSKAYKRKAFAQKADDTLDDVSEIISDFTDIPSDSSVGMQLPVQPGRRPSQETSSDAKAEDLSGSLGSEPKILADETKQMSNPKIEVDESSANKAYEDDDGSEKSETDGQVIADKTAHQTEKPCDTKSSSDKQHRKDDNEERSVLSEGIVQQHGSNEQNKTKQANVKTSELGKQDLDEQHEQGHEHDRLGTENVSNQQNQREEKDKHRDLLQASSSKDLKMKDAFDDNGDEKAEEQDVGEPMEEQDGSVHQVHSDVDASEDNPAEPSEEYNMEEPVNEQNDTDDESREFDQMDNESVDEQDVSSEQGGLNNASEQENSSNRDYQMFARGQYIRFPISSTPDSGIEHSSAAFDPGYPPVPENSESNEASALGSSSAAGLQNLQNWMDRGAVAASADAPPASNEGIPGPSNAAEQAGPFPNRQSFPNFVGDKTLNVAKLETIEDTPMECVEHFAETPTEGSIVEIMPNVQMTFEERTEGETNVGQVQLEVKNLNVSTGCTSTELNVNLIQETSSGANNQDLIPGVVDEENNSIHGGETAANNEISSLNPKTSQRLTKDDSDQKSSSSQEQSRESSLADMDDAIESSDSVSREAELQRTPGANTNLLHTSAASSTSLAKGSGSKPQRSKRRARKSGDNNSPFKKRKDTITCGQQARATISSLKKQKPDSDDESSKDDQKFKG